MPTGEHLTPTGANTGTPMATSITSPAAAPTSRSAGTATGFTHPAWGQQGDACSHASSPHTTTACPLHPRFRMGTGQQLKAPPERAWAPLGSVLEQNMLYKYIHIHNRERKGGGRARPPAGHDAPLCPALPPPELLSDDGFGGHICVPGDAGGYGALDTAQEAVGLEHPRPNSSSPLCASVSPPIRQSPHSQALRRQALVGRGCHGVSPWQWHLASGSRAPGSAGPHPRRGRWCRRRRHRGQSGCSASC